MRRLNCKRAVFFALFVSLILLVSCSTPPPSISSSNGRTDRGVGRFDVCAFGAKGDGKTKDTAAFQKALNTCAATGGGTVYVTNGVYLIGSIVIGSNTTLRVENRASLMGSPDPADYPIIQVRWEGEFRKGHRALIYAENAKHVAIAGRGIIYGPPISVSRLRDPRGPALIEFSECEDILLDGFTTLYQQLWSIHPVLCKKIVARNLTIRTVSFNGDGLDVDSCSDVLIEHCNVDTGDDAVVLKSGRGASAAELGRPTENVVILDCTLSSSLFAGFGIGTELSGGIRNVRLEDCTISGRQNAIFFKSRDGRGAFIENFVGKNLTVQNSPTFLGIDLIKKGIQASDPIPGHIEQWTRMSNVLFEDVRVNNVTDLVLARDIPAARPVNGLTFSNVRGTCEHGFTLANMTNVVLTNINVTGYRGPLVTTQNVSGSGLAEPK